MITAARYLALFLKVIACLWAAFLVIGIFGKMYVFMLNMGFWEGLKAWLAWFDPTAVSSMVVRGIEAIPAILALWAAGALDRWRSKRAPPTPMPVRL
jgi:hypothetical protein